MEITKQVFDKEMKRMRVKSRKQQKKTERWKEQAEMHEGRLRRMSTDYGKTKKDRKGLNKEINVLERKFKYVGLRTSLDLPQDTPRQNAEGIVHMEASSRRSAKESHLARKCG